MKKMQVLTVNCCSEENKCKECPPAWTRKYFVEIDDELKGDKRYTIFFPLSGFDEQMRSKVKYFNPYVIIEGIWYLKHQDALKIYKHTEKHHSLEQTIEVLKKKCNETEVAQEK